MGNSAAPMSLSRYRKVQIDPVLEDDVLDDLLEKIAGRIPYSKEEVHYVFVTDRAETRGEYIAPRLVEAVLDERDLGEKRSRVGACTRSSTSASRIAALARAFRVDACQYKIGVTTNSRALS